MADRPLRLEDLVVVAAHILRSTSRQHGQRAMRERHVGAATRTHSKRYGHYSAGMKAAGPTEHRAAGVRSIIHTAAVKSDGSPDPTGPHGNGRGHTEGRAVRSPKKWISLKPEGSRYRRKSPVHRSPFSSHTSTRTRVHTHDASTYIHDLAHIHRLACASTYASRAAASPKQVPRSCEVTSVWYKSLASCSAPLFSTSRAHW